ncbi:hypothetical protein Mapa_012796 [Marchantia paleacea]|nr:hypothetical protein Mapa_012796 [Marchantia paleacea]
MGVGGEGKVRLCCAHTSTAHRAGNAPTNLTGHWTLCHTSLEPGNPKPTVFKSVHPRSHSSPRHTIANTSLSTAATERTKQGEDPSPEGMNHESLYTCFQEFVGASNFSTPRVLNE